MQRLYVELTSSSCVLDEYSRSSLNDILLSCVNYSTDETKSSAFLTYECQNNLQLLLLTGDLLQNNK